MGTPAQVCMLSGLASLITAIAWPLVVAAALIFFRNHIRNLLSRVTAAKVLGVEWTVLGESTKVTAESLLSDDAGFEKIKDLLDWNRVAAEVRNWGSKHRAANPSDMGPNNFKRFLFDTGLPGGKNTTLEWDANGSLKYQ